MNSVVLNEDSDDEQDHRGDDEPKLFLQRMLMVMLMRLVLMMLLMIVLVIVLVRTSVAVGMMFM